MSAPSATSRHERPMFFPAGGETLFGIHTRPSGEPLGIGVILLAVKATYYRNRLAVRLARDLAAEGFDVFRFDYHGVGESTGSAVFHLDRPFVDDLLGAVAWARAEGLTRFIVLGQCFGARTALAAAARIEGLLGLVCVAMPFRDGKAASIEGRGVGHYLRRGLRPSTWMLLARAKFRQRMRDVVSALLRRAAGRQQPAPGDGAPRFRVNAGLRRAIESAVDRRVPVLFVYGKDDPQFQEFLAVRDGGLRKLFERASSIELASLPGELHAFRDVTAQETFLSTARLWIGERAARAAGRSIEREGP